MMSPEEIKEHRKREKAKQLRYKHPIAAGMSLETIRSELWEMGEAVSDIQWFESQNESNLVEALDGDEDEAYEFRMAFTDLAAELERFEADMESEWIADCFDDFFPAVGASYFGGYLGFDGYEGDYYGLAPYEYEWAEKESQKRVSRLTKAELYQCVGSCLKVAVSWIGLKYRYDCLKASLDIIRERNMEALKLMRAIDEQYEKAEPDFGEAHETKEVRELDEMLRNVPQEYWIT